MRPIRFILIALLFISCCVGNAFAEPPVLAAGAGYKKMVNALAAAYSKRTDNRVDLIYGNMGRVTTLAKRSGQVDIVIGAESYLLETARLTFVRSELLGNGKLVLAFPIGSPFSSVADLDSPEVGRIALPDGTKAIYGRAARQFLTKTARLPGIKPCLTEVATVPQVFSYLATGEVDMGFLNLTHALNVKDKLGGYVVVNEVDYQPIRIIAGLLEDGKSTKKAEEFLQFLTTAEARTIIQDNGL